MNIFYNNKHTFRIFLVCLIFLFGKNGIAQTGISGKITDEETGEEMISANIVVSKKGIFVQGETTDIDGNYRIKVDEGTYDLEVSYTGYFTRKITGIVVEKGESKKVDVGIGSGGMIIGCGFGCGAYKIPLIKQDETTTGMTTESQKIKKIPTRNINEISSITPGVSFTQ